MASTLSGQGKGSLGVIHLQVGASMGSTACGRGTRAVTIKSAVLVSCKRCKAILAKKVWCMKCRTRHLITTPHDQDLGGLVR